LQAAKAAERNDQHAAPARKRQHTAATNVDLHDLSLLGKRNLSEKQHSCCWQLTMNRSSNQTLFAHADIILKHSNAIDKAVEVSSGNLQMEDAACCCCSLPNSIFSTIAEA
jgi:hypothetical protein